MSHPCTPRKIFLIRLKITACRFERVERFLNWKSDAFCLCKSDFVADYIVTELKSPSRIVRNAKQSTCPVVHINWLLESLCSKKILDPDKYMINVSAARTAEVSLPLKALPKQMKWSQLADRHNRDKSSTMHFTAASEKRLHYSHKRGYQKPKKRQTRRSKTSQSIKRECSQTKKEGSIIKQEKSLTTVKYEAGSAVKKEPIAEDLFEASQ